MICRSERFLAQIYPSESEESISLNVENKCTMMPLENTGERSTMTHPIKAYKFHIQRSK